MLRNFLGLRGAKLLEIPAKEILRGQCSVTTVTRKLIGLQRPVKKTWRDRRGSHRGVDFYRRPNDFGMIWNELRGGPAPGHALLGARFPVM